MRYPNQNAACDVSGKRNKNNRYRLKLQARRLLLGIGLPVLVVMLSFWFQADRQAGAFKEQGSMRAVQVMGGGSVSAPSEDKIIPEEDDKEPWSLVLVNQKNPLPDDYTPVLKSLANGLKFDERAIGQLNRMLEDARQQGLSPVVCSAYRSLEKQGELFNRQVGKQMAQGWGPEQAHVKACQVVAYPGTSEHNLGLAADIVASSYQCLEENQAGTPEVKWLTEHCSQYGFIVRYPRDKTDITGIIYEPWHFRYVGVEAAQEIMGRGICLEEYLGE